jgi:hypothetical protein
MTAPTVPNPTTKAPGASGSSTTAASPNVGAGYKLPANAVVNSYGQTVLNPGIGSALAPLAIPPVSKIPAPPAKAPAPTPSKPPAPAPAAKAPPAAPAGGNSGSGSGNSGNSGIGSGSGLTTAPVITLASSSAKGGSTKNSDGSITFTPTGNVPTDLAALAAAGADALTISYYMSIYGNSWNYGIGSQGMSKNIPQNPPREVSGHMLTTNTPGMSQAEANAVAILNKAGLTQQAVKSQAVYVFTDPTNPRAQISVSKAAYDASTPAQQLAIQIQVGNIPKGATIPKSAIVNGVWNGQYTVPGNNTVQSSGPTPISKYTTTNADGSQSVNLAAALAGGVTADYLIQQGFTKQQITQAQEYNSVMTTLKPYTTSAGTNLAAALASGKVTPQQLEDVGFDNSAGGAIQTAEKCNALQAILDNPKNNIKTSNGYQINVALANKNLSVSDLTALGFQQPAISQAQAYNVILNKLGLPATTTTINAADAINKGVTENQWLAAFPNGKAAYKTAMVPVKTIPTTGSSSKSAATKVVSKTAPLTKTSQSVSTAKAVLSVIGNNVTGKNPYTQAELKAMYQNYQKPTGKDIENALIAIGNPDTYLGAKISAVGKLFTLLTSTNPVVKLKNGTYALMQKEEVDVSDNPAAVAAETVESTTDWDKVLDSVNEASQGARDQGVNLGNMPMRTNEGITQISPNYSGTSFNTNPDYISEWTARMAAAETPTAGQPQTGTLVMTAGLTPASRVAATAYAQSISHGINPARALVITQIVTANAVANPQALSTGKILPVNQLKLTPQQKTVVLQAATIGQAINKGIADLNQQVAKANPKLSAAKTAAVVNSLVRGTNLLAIEQDTGRIVQANTAETMRKNSGVTAHPQVEELPSWLDDAEVESLKKRGLTMEQIYALLNQSGGSRQMFNWLADEAVRIMKKNKSQEDALQKAIDEERAKRLEAERNQSKQPAKTEVEKPASAANVPLTTPPPLENTFVVPNAWERTIGSQRNTQISKEDLGAALSDQMTREEDVLTFVKITWGPDGIPTITSWQVKMPALIKGMVKDIEDADLSDMKFQTELQEQAYRKQLAQNATKLGNKLLNAKQPVNVTQLVNATSSDADTTNKEKFETELLNALNFALQHQQQQQTSTKTSTKPSTSNQTTTDNETAANTGNQMSTQTNVGPATSVSTAVTTATPNPEPPPSNSIAGVLPKKGKKPQDESAAFTDKQLASAATHKAGFGWWYFVGGQWRFLLKPPPGAKAGGKGKGSGYGSVQTIKGKPVISTHRMGAVTVTINRPSTQPGVRGAISYHATGAVRPHMDMIRKGRVIHVKGVGLTRLVPRGRVQR